MIHVLVRLSAAEVSIGELNRILSGARVLLRFAKPLTINESLVNYVYRLALGRYTLTSAHAARADSHFMEPGINEFTTHE